MLLLLQEYRCMKTVIFNKSERFFVTKIKILNNKHISKIIIDIKNLTEINKCINVQINSSNDIKANNKIRKIYFRIIISHLSDKINKQRLLNNIK